MAYTKTEIAAELMDEIAALNSLVAKIAKGDNFRTTINHLEMTRDAINRLVEIYKEEVENELR